MGGGASGMSQGARRIGPKPGLRMSAPPLPSVKGAGVVGAQPARGAGSNHWPVSFTLAESLVVPMVPPPAGGRA